MSDDPNDITEEIREDLEDGDTVGHSTDEGDSDGAVLTLDDDEAEADEE